LLTGCRLVVIAGHHRLWKNLLGMGGGKSRYKRGHGNSAHEMGTRKRAKHRASFQKRD
jgi:hypothetical protein